MHYNVVLAFTFPRSYLWMLPCCFVLSLYWWAHFKPYLCLNQRFNSWVNVSQHPDGFSEKPRFATDPGLPSLMVCVVTALFCAFVCNKFLPTCYFTPLFNPGFTPLGGWWGFTNCSEKGCKIMVTWEVNWSVNQSRLRVKSVGIVEKGRLNWNQGNQ